MQLYKMYRQNGGFMFKRKNSNNNNSSSDKITSADRSNIASANRSNSLKNYSTSSSGSNVIPDDVERRDGPGGE
jgi:hypothetical protein